MESGLNPTLKRLKRDSKYLIRYCRKLVIIIQKRREMRTLLPFFLLFSILFANEQASTKSDIQMILKVMEANKVDLENQMKAMKSDLENQIKAVNSDLGNQVKATNRRIDDVNGYMLALLAGIFATVGFIWWDRRTMISKAKEEIESKLHYALEQKADHTLLNKLLNAMRELAKNNKEIDTALKKQGLSYL
jgi:hypothetical protein